MNFSHFTYWRGVTVAVALLGCCAGASAENPSSPAEVAAPPSVEMREPQPGDHWVYRVKDEISGAVKRTRTDTITEVTPNEITVRIQASDRDSPNVILYDGAWNIKQEFPFKYSPHDGNGVQLPLKVGAAWKSSVDIINTKEGMTFKRTGASKVVGEETISTPAGTFDTFVVETTATSKNAQDPTLVNQISMRTWFCPSINHWVKRTAERKRWGHVTDSISFELIDYGRKKQ